MIIRLPPPALTERVSLTDVLSFLIDLKDLNYSFFYYFYFFY